MKKLITIILCTCPMVLIDACITQKKGCNRRYQTKQQKIYNELITGQHDFGINKKRRKKNRKLMAGKRQCKAFSSHYNY